MPARSTTRSGLLGLVALLAVPFALTSCSGINAPAASRSTSPATSSSHPAPRTEANSTVSGTHEVAFDPYSPQGTPLDTIIVIRTVTGTCVTPGVAGTSSYRCFARPSSTVYDPCFAPPHATAGPLVCVADPAQPAATRFNVGTLPTEPTSGPTKEPWAMRLSNGQTCVLVAAAWDGLGPFACLTPAPSPPSEADCHHPSEATPTWSAACQASEDPSSPFKQVQVVTIWS